MELVGTTKTIGGITGSYTDYNIQADGNNPGHTYQYYTNTPVFLTLTEIVTLSFASAFVLSTDTGNRTRKSPYGGGKSFRKIIDNMV